MLNLDLFINGLIIGLFYALMAAGLTLIFGILKVVNFAHGEFYMVGAYTYTLAALKLGFDPWLALPLALAAGAAAGCLTERPLMRINLVDKVVGPYPQRGPGLVDIPRMALGPIMLSGQKLVATGISLATIAGLALFLRYSLWGRQIQAVAQNRLGASLAGIDTARASSLVFALSGALAALAGALLAPIINASPDVGAFPAIKSYVIVVLGGMGSMPGRSGEHTSE